jgi:hypothetical protein
MSVRECIWIDHPVNVEAYVQVLKEEFGAQPHPEQSGAFLIGDPPLPFYEPKLVDERLAITSFNYKSLPDTLLEALARHPELVPPSAQVNWTMEQDLLFEGTLEGAGQRLRGKER